MAENALEHITGITHIVWDWNGTLLDDNHANIAAVNSVCAAFGRDQVDLEYWRSIFRRPLVSCYEELLGRRFVDGEWERVAQAYEGRYLRELPDCALAEGVPRVLDEWSRAGGTQSLLSMSAHDILGTLVAEWGLTSRFTRIDGRRFETERDSKSDHLVAHLASQGIDPATVVLIGDIDDDARAAREAGTHAVLVASGLMDPGRLAATGCPVLAAPADVVPALLR